MQIQDRAPVPGDIASIQVKIRIVGRQLCSTIDCESAISGKENAHAVGTENGATIEEEARIVSVDLKIVEIDDRATVQYDIVVLENEGDSSARTSHGGVTVQIETSGKTIGAGVKADSAISIDRNVAKTPR